MKKKATKKDRTLSERIDRQNEVIENNIVIPSLVAVITSVLVNVAILVAIQ